MVVILHSSKVVYSRSSLLRVSADDRPARLHVSLSGPRSANVSSTLY